MPRSMVGLVAAVAATMAILASLAPGYLFWLVAALVAAAAGLAGYATAPDLQVTKLVLPSKKALCITEISLGSDDLSDIETIRDAELDHAARLRAWPLAWPSPSGPLGWQRLRRSRVGPEDRFCEAVRNDLRVPLTLEGPARTMRGAPAR